MSILEAVQYSLLKLMKQPQYIPVKAAPDKDGLIYKPVNLRKSECLSVKLSKDSSAAGGTIIKSKKLKHKQPSSFKCR
jgi:hypothetical protein